MSLSLVVSAACLLFCGFSFIYFRAYLRRRTGARRILEDFEEEVNKLIAGIDAAADRDITLLEDRSRTIKAMLETLDRRIAAHARELDRREKQEAALDALAPEGGSTGATAAVTTEGAKKADLAGARAEEAYAALGRGLRSSLRVNPPESQPALSGTAERPAEPIVPVDPAPAGASPQPRFIRSANPVKAKTPLAEQARELHRNGFSPETIAVRLGATLAEVNLALALPDPPSP
jgi:hypothetical protein